MGCRPYTPKPTFWWRLQNAVDMQAREGASLPAQIASILVLDAADSLAALSSAAAGLDAFYLVPTVRDSGRANLRNLLMLAASYGAPQCAAHLLAGGASANLPAPGDGSTALHMACQSAAGNPPQATAHVIALLLSHGADRELRDATGRTPADLLTGHAGLVGAGRLCLRCKSSTTHDGDLPRVL